MDKWTEQEFFDNVHWFHGTTNYGAKAILRSGIITTINKNRPLDFGYGFYLCPSFNWSLGYIKGQLEVVDDDLDIKRNDGYVLEYNFKPSEILKNSSNYKFFDELNDEFGVFVFNNREKYKKHLIKKCIHDFDLVAGPMSDGKQLDDFNEFHLKRISKGELLERLLMPKENWQLLLHKQYLCDNLKPVAIYNLKGERVYEVT